MDTPHAQAAGYAGRHAARRARTLAGLRGRRPVVALTAAVLSGGALVALPASAAGPVPAFPDNIVVFPDRDFVSIEGYSGRGGETATVEVVRDGAVVGSAKSLISGTDVAFEVNHPGGVCWGAGTSLQVTPDIRAGDVVRLTFGDGTSQETTTSSATVTSPSLLSGTTLTVDGTYGPDVNPAQLEQRIVNPDLTDTDVGRRTVRAVPGGMVRAPRGGYSSDLVAADGTFRATYVFDSAATASTADVAEFERAMSWQVEDAAGNRQGLTIAELGEQGGPGMGGCPAGPGDQVAGPGTYSAVRSATDPTTMQVKWTPATVQPGAAAVSGYSVTAISATAGADGQFAQLGVRTGAGAQQAVLTGLASGETYTVEVRALTGARMGDPFIPAATGTPSPDLGDVTQPTLTLTPAPDTAGGPTEASSVSIASDGQVFYTTGTTPAISGNLPSDDAVLYTGPIPITAPTQLHVVAFDRAGNSTSRDGLYTPPAAASQPPAAPTGFAGTAGQGKVDLRWDAVTDATAYQVTVYAANGVALTTQPAETTARAQTVTGLTAGTPYDVTVKARKAGTGFGDETPKLRLTPQAVTDQITIGTARWKSGEFRVTGSGSVVGSTVTVHSVTATGAIGAPIPGATGTVVAAVAPAIGDYDVRLRDGAAPATNPGRVYVKSSGGGVAGPSTVTTR